MNNARLPKVLATFSAASPPPPSAVPPPESGEPPLWTLDALFLLPKGRLKYYKKLYSRLLKSTTPGRSDHRLLIGALDKLDRLMATLEARGDIQVSTLALAPPASSPAAADAPAPSPVALDIPSPPTSVPTTPPVEPTPPPPPPPPMAEEESVIETRTQSEPSQPNEGSPSPAAQRPPRERGPASASVASSFTQASSNTSG